MNPKPGTNGEEGLELSRFVQTMRQIAAVVAGRPFIRDAGAGGSNPLTPTKFCHSGQSLRNSGRKCSVGHLNPQAGFVAASLLASCASADRDAWGNAYPPECSIAATSAVHAPVIRVGQAFLDRATGVPGRVGVMLPTGAVAVRDDLTGGLLLDTVRHEKCHLLMRALTGSPDWH